MKATQWRLQEAAPSPSLAGHASYRPSPGTAYMSPGRSGDHRSPSEPFRRCGRGGNPMSQKATVFGFVMRGALFGLSLSSYAAMPISAVGSIDEMQALSGAASPAVQAFSYHPGLNRGGGLFVWNAEATGPADNCVTFAPKAAQKGRWIRQLNGAL